MPARLTTSRASYSKNLILSRPVGGSAWAWAVEPYMTGALYGRGLKPVGLGQLGVLAGQHFGEPDHHLALLPGGVVLHLAVDHVHPAPVGDGLDHLLGEG